MRFYRLDEIPISGDDQVFKESPVINAVAALIFFGIATALVFVGLSKWQPSHGHMAPYAPYCVAAFFAIIGLFPLFNFRASLKPTNWLLRCNLSGIFLKYRAYENWRLPADSLQVVGLEYGEIAWAKLVKERRTTPGNDTKHSSETTWYTYIDLGLVDPKTSDLEVKLEAERNIRPDGVIVSCDYPVQVLPGGIVEVRWSAGIRPSAKMALERLGQRVKILETEHRKTDLTQPRNATANPADANPKIIALARSGDEIGAVNLVRQVYGYSLTDATNFVDKLLGRTGD